MQSSRSRRGGPPSLESLRAQVAELEQARAQFGARGIEEDKPGALARIVDVLSRPNYAIAGFAEEVLEETPSVSRGVKRALTEIFSGVGGLQGEKRAFGEVLERLKVGTVTLADAFPALEGTWIGNFGSRGAAGLALDIATDPLTYMTFGASSGIRISTSKGLRYLNRAGNEAFNGLVKKHLDDAIKAIPGVDDVARTRQGTRALNEAEKEFEKLFTVGKDIRKDFLEPGGAKLFGATIPGTEGLGGRAVNMLPESIAKPAVEGARKLRRGMMRSINGIFSPEGPLANLPQPIRERAVRITNDFFRSTQAHRGHLFARMDPLRRRFQKLAKKDPGIDKRWYDVREGVRPISDITDPEELDLYRKTMALYDEMGRTALDHGVLTDAQILPNYIYHTYKNVESLSTYHPRPGVKLDPGSKARFQKERKFESANFAEEESKRLNELSLRLVSRGEADRIYPALEHNYDVFGNMNAYIGAHADALARKAWREELVSQFGKKLNTHDFDEMYDEVVDNIPTKKTPGAPADFTPERVPLRRVIEEGDVEPVMEALFGTEGARYVAVKGAITGNEMAFLPRAIVDTLEGVNSQLFNTRDYREFGKLVKGFDWANNNFKWGVYTVWPASAIRDAYSNIALSMLRVGVAALDPKRHADAILLMSKRNLGKEFAGTGFTVGQLRDMSKRLGVWVPGTVFVEQTGRFKLGKFRRELLEKRAGIENEARVLLWLEEIRRGADPRLAADTVGRFLFNYGEVSRVERDLFRRLIPFYTFTRKNVELQWKMLRRNPGMSINQIKPFRGRTDENEQMVKWESEGLKIRLDRDGKTIHAITGIDLPLRNLDNIWAGGFGATGRRLLGMMTPVLKVPLEVTTGRDFFTGADIVRTRADTLGRIVEMTRTPKAVRDWLGYTKRFDDAGRPIYEMDGARYALLVRSWMFSRVFSTSDRQFREYLNDDNISRAFMDVLTGIRRKDIDLDEQGRRKLSRRVRQLQESLERRGAVRRGTFAFDVQEGRTF